MRRQRTAVEDDKMHDILWTSLVDLGSISSTYLRAAFTPVAPQSVRTQSSCQYLFTLLKSARVKAVRRMLMKLSPRFDFTIILRPAFCLYSFTRKLQSQNVSREKLHIKCWWHWQLKLISPPWQFFCWYYK